MTSLAIILEFTRTHEPQDPYAFRFLPQDYTRRTTGGGVERIRIEWNDEFLADLTALRDPRHDPALVRKIGEQLRQALNAAAWSSIEKQGLLTDLWSMNVPRRNHRRPEIAVSWRTRPAASAHIS